MLKKAVASYGLVGKTESLPYFNGKNIISPPNVTVVMSPGQYPEVWNVIIDVDTHGDPYPKHHSATMLFHSSELSGGDGVERLLELRFNAAKEEFKEIGLTEGGNGTRR